MNHDINTTYHPDIKVGTYRSEPFSIEGMQAGDTVTVYGEISDLPYPTKTAVDAPLNDEHAGNVPEGHPGAVDAPDWLIQGLSPPHTVNQHLLAQFTAAAITGILAGPRGQFRFQDKDVTIDVAAVNIARDTLAAFN